MYLFDRRKQCKHSEQTKNGPKCWKRAYLEGF